MSLPRQGANLFCFVFFIHSTSILSMFKKNVKYVPSTMLASLGIKRNYQVVWYKPELITKGINSFSISSTAVFCRILLHLNANPHPVEFWFTGGLMLLIATQIAWVDITFWAIAEQNLLNLQFLQNAVNTVFWLSKDTYSKEEKFHKYVHKDDEF